MSQPRTNPRRKGDKHQTKFIGVYIPEAAASRIKADAKRNHRSMSGHIRYLLLGDNHPRS